VTIKQHTTRAAALVAAVALLAAACGNDDDGEDPGADAPEEAVEAGGELYL
jgi:oligopeptide transport system substrate-binding protein